MKTEREIRKMLEEIKSGQNLRDEGFHEITDKGSWWEEVLEWVLDIKHVDTEELKGVVRDVVED